MFYEVLGEPFVYWSSGSSCLVIDHKMTESFLKVKDYNQNVSWKCISSVFLSTSGIPDMFLSKLSYFEKKSMSLVVRIKISKENTPVSFQFLGSSCYIWRLCDIYLKFWMHHLDVNVCICINIYYRFLLFG